MIRLVVLVAMILAFGSEALALHLTDRQVTISDPIDVANAQKTSAKLLVMDSGAKAPIYLMLSSSKGSAQGVLLLADTIRSMNNPVVAVVQVQVHGAGAALAVLTDRLVMYRSSGLVFTEVDYQGVKKPEPPKVPPPKDAKVPTAGDKLLQSVRTAYLERFWDRIASRLKLKTSDLEAKLASGGFAYTPIEALRKKIARSVVEKLRYTKLGEAKSETKITTTRKRDRTTGNLKP